MIISNATIISDGTTRGTIVDVDGKKLEGITKIEIDTIKAGRGLIEARITIIGLKLNVDINNPKIEEI